MNPRAEHLISLLQLAPHPEGGYFREIYRSVSRVQPLDQRPERTALTTIYFLLTSGDVSRWHRVTSDEVWHYYEGDAIKLMTADPNFQEISQHRLGPVDEDQQPVHIVPAHSWQAARTTGAYTLVGCTVGPGFEFADFQMLRDLTTAAEIVKQQHPEVMSFI